ncbi:DUF2971 domain-containing protein [Paraburkholderia tropica]|uniref:DUF2971 domain-containing protein n=1 Tax=Paraburkholderia tropica TaxID=92647 RepID=UPI0038BCB357
MYQSRWHTEQTARHLLLQSFGVACFTRDWNNELFWAHYAKNHTGFCVGFDEDVLTSWADVVDFGDIAYINNAQTFKVFFDGERELLRKVVFHKSINWAYEREFRLLFNRPGAFSLPGGAIREVILGCRAPYELRAKARKHLDDAKGPVIYQAIESLREYRISRERIEHNVFTMTSQF